MAYRGHSPPRGERWDRDRFDSYARGPSVVERDRYEEVDYYSPPRHREQERGPPRRVQEAYYYDEKDRYEVPYRPRREPAKYYDDEGSTYEGAMVPVRRRDDERDIEIDIRRREYDRYSPRSPPPRPTFVRRQSSLDTFDRRPMPRYGDRVHEETIQIPAGPRRRSPPRYRSPPRFVERDYEDIRIQEPEFYGDEEFRGYREREISRVRRNRDYEVEEEREEIITSEFPKRGKTKMPMRLVNKQAIIQLGYPFEEEGETIIILKALGREHIDEVIKISRELNSRPAPLPPPVEETRTTYVIEHPTPPPPPQNEEKVVERRTEIIRELGPSPGSPNPDPPRSVKEWDVLSRHESRHESRHDSRSPSPTNTHRTHQSRKSSRSHHHNSHSHSRARSVSSASTRREIIIAEDREESGTVRAGVGALIVPSRERRTDRDIKDQIRALEHERRALRVERESDHRLRSEDRDRELLVVKERDDEVVEVRKDRKAPDPRIIRAMLKTLT